MSWTIGEVIGETFRSFTRNWVTLVIGNLIVGAISFAPAAIWMVLAALPLLRHAQMGDNLSPAEPAAFIGSMLLAILSSAVLWILFAPALARIAIAAARGARPRLSAVFDFSRAGTYFGAGILSGLAICGGMLLLIVPGIIVALGLSMVTFFVVDERIDSADALSASWTAMRGHRLQLFALALIAGVVHAILQHLFGLTIFLAPLALVLGLVTTPLWTLALAIIYTRIRGPRRGELPAIAAQGLSDSP